MVATVIRVGTELKKVRLRVVPRLIPRDGVTPTIAVGDVTTLPNGSPATVDNVGTSTAAIFDFGLPSGETGPVAEIELQNNGTYIQWRQIGEPDWIDIVALADITGPDGEKGWSPVFAIASDGTRRVLQVNDWVGGAGTKPATGDYVGASGLTAVIGNAVDIRGPAGAGTGDVVGPASAVDSHVALFNGTTGKLLKSANTLFSSLVQYTATSRLVTLASAAIAGAGFNLPSGVAPNTPVNGDVWHDGSGIQARWSGATFNLISPFASFLQGVVPDANLPDYLVTTVTTRAALKALDTTQVTAVVFDGSSWTFRSGNYTTLHGLDTGEGVYIKATAVASSAGSWVRNHDGELNLLWFQVTGDGSTDDAPQITKALRLGNLFAFYAPAGTYVCNSPVTADDVRVSIRGAGIYPTVFKFTTDADGFSLGQTTAIGTLWLKDFGIQTTQAASTRKAVRAVMATPGGGNINPSCIVDNIEMRGVTVASMWWQDGLHITNPAASSYSNILFWGRVGGTSAQITTIAGAAIRVLSTQYAVFQNYEKVHALYVNRAISVESSGTTGSEGIYINRCDAVHVNTGFYIVSTDAGGYRSFQVSVINCHAEFFTKAVYMSQCADVMVGHNVFYSEAGVNGALQGIHLVNVSRGVIGDNYIEARATQTAMQGVQVQNCTGIIARDNICDTPDVGVVFNGTTTLSQQHGNTNRWPAINAFADISSGVNNSGLVPGAGITINPNLGAYSGPNVSITAGSVRQTLNLSSSGSVLGANTTYYIGNGGAANGTEVLAAGLVTCAGAFSDLMVKQNTAPGGAQTTIYTLMKNGVATALTCTVSASGTTASDVANTVAFAKGDAWSVRVVNSTTAASTIPSGGICFKPTVV